MGKRRHVIRAFSLFIVLGFAFFAQYSESVLSQAEIVKGIDYPSGRYRKIDWNKLYDAGYRFAFIKATEGTGFKTRKFESDIEGLIRHNRENPNKIIFLGVYHFARPVQNPKGAKQEALWFSKVFKPYLNNCFILRPALDVENCLKKDRCTQGKDEKPGEVLKKDGLSQWVNEWMQTVKQELGMEVTPLLYTNPDYIENYLDDSITQYDLWIAHWIAQKRAPEIGKRVPGIGGKWRWVFWQYAGDVPGIPGVTGNTPTVDLNVFNGDVQRLYDFCIKPAPVLDAYPEIPSKAPLVSPGTYSDRGGELSDPRDCLAVEVNRGQRVSLELTGPKDTDFNLWIYKPGNVFRPSWTSTEGNTSDERIIIDYAPETGRYPICVYASEESESRCGVWSLTIKVEGGLKPPPTTPPSAPPTPTPTPPPTRPPPPPPKVATASVLVMDVSGSMAWTWQGEVKLESAKRVASQTINLIEQESKASGAAHSLAVVSFTDQADLLLPLTNDYRRAKGVVLSLGTAASTNLGAGLQAALAELSKAPITSQKYIILLTDGHITSGMSEWEVLADPVVEARQRKICIHTVGFGDPSYLKEEFLRQVSQGSGCGEYVYAKDPFELTNTYIKLRHLSLGGSIAEFASQGAKIYQGQTLTLGAVRIPSPQENKGQEVEELHFTLTWPGSRLQPRLFDPQNEEVTSTYPGADIRYFEQFAHVVVLKPQPGLWRVVITGEDVPPGGTDFYAVLSTRPGEAGKLANSIRLFNPTVCVEYPGGRRECGYLIQGNIPTWMIFLINIVVAVVVIYLLLSGKMPS